MTLRLKSQPSRSRKSKTFAKPVVSRVEFGGPAFQKSWPVKELQLSNPEIAALQRLLEAKGYPMGTIDGRIGKGTRKAVQAVQKGFGMVPDGHPSPAVLARLRAG